MSKGDDSTTTRTEKGISLARGPALILGHDPASRRPVLPIQAAPVPEVTNFPNGKVPAPRQGVPWDLRRQRLDRAADRRRRRAAAVRRRAAPARQAMSLIVGIALSAAAVIALISDNVLGLAAANGWTEILWGGAAGSCCSTPLSRAAQRQSRTTAPLRLLGAARSNPHLL